MVEEINYDFRKRIDIVHKPDIFDRTKTPESGEIVIDDSWKIIYTGILCQGCAALDLQDYFQTCMGISLPIVRHATEKKYFLLREKTGDKGFELAVTDSGVLITGNIRKGVHRLEDIMNFREAPYIPVQETRCDPIFTPRMVHSGWGHDSYPDSHLNAISHAGFDTILIFVTGPDRNAKREYVDLNDLVERAAKYGLGVYLYSYLNSYKHPDDPDAEEFFDRNFGTVFKRCPKAGGIILVGESCAFPSKDHRCGTVKQDGLRPRSGFFPADDYPQWLNAVKKAVRKYSPEADVVFWTYNWGNNPPEERLPLIAKLPEDISVEVTYEMFEQRQYENCTLKVPDYTITFPGPGSYFISEAEAVHRRGMRLYTITNTAGVTWDCGVMPYMPVPQQWFKRFRTMHEAHQRWGLSGIMDSHHNGWFPGPITECARWCFNTPSADPDEILHKIAVRDFGEDAAEDVIKAWQMWSDAMASYTPGFDDQAGPLRVGPSYPFIFYPILYPFAEQEMHFPFSDYAYRRERILNTLYKPEHVIGHTFIGRRIREDIKIMTEALRKWQEGEALMDIALAKVPAAKKAGAALQIGIGKFFTHTLRTTINMKKWYLLNRQIELTSDFDEANTILDEMTAILEDEKLNALETIPLAEADSRLGWEPSMEYACDREHIEWKLEKLERILRYTIPHYRDTVKKFEDDTIIGKYFPELK